MNPDAFKYNFGFKDPVFYEFATSYLRIPGFNKMADVKQGKVFNMECEKGNDNELGRFRQDVDSELCLAFKKFAATHKFFAFLVKLHSSKCEPGKKKDRGVHLMTVFYNGYTNHLEIYPEPLQGYFADRWELWGDSSFGPQIRAMLKECGVKIPTFDVIEVPIDFIYKTKSSSAAEAMLRWCLLFAKERVSDPKQSFGLFSRGLIKKWNPASLNLLYKAYEGYVDKYTKDKCPQKKVFNSETGACITKSAAKKYAVLKERKPGEIDKILAMEGDVRGMMKKNPYVSENEWLAYFRLKYPLLDSVEPDLEYEKIPKMFWSKNAEGNYFLEVEEGVVDALDEFFEKPEKRFFMTRLNIHSKDYKPGMKSGFWAHANLLIYDRFYNEIEIWEPHGYQFGRAEDAEVPQMYDAIKAWMHEKVREGILPHEVSLILPMDYCPVGEFFQRREAIDFVRGEEAGLCETWAWWYIDTRLANPTINRKEAVKLALNQLRSLPDVRVYIRKYKQAIDSQLQEITALGQEEFEGLLKDAEAKWKAFTETVCTEWNKNKSINPRTGKKISEKGKVWKQLHYTCP